MAPSLQVLAIQAEQIRQQVRALQSHAREVFAGQAVEREITVGECHAIDILMGQVGAAFRSAEKRADRAQHEARYPNARETMPCMRCPRPCTAMCPCGCHGPLTNADRVNAEEAASRG